MVKKRDPNHDRTRAPIIKGECGSSSQGFKPTCSTREKKHFGKCLVCTGNFFCCGKDGHKVTFFLILNLEKYLQRNLLLVL